jgi:tripartite-type tricarboxylate transporter receptor subunit TctC
MVRPCARQKTGAHLREDDMRLIGQIAAIAAAITISAHAAQAQDYPTRPIRMIIAFPPGGPTDFVGRLLADKMKELLGQPVIIENKAGANGAIGADFVAKSEPDGHTIFLTTVGAVAITPGMRNDLPYNTLRDFAPVTLVVRNTTILVVRSQNAVASARDLAAQAKAKPNEIAFASTGVGSMPHLALELFQSAAGAKFLHVPYRGAAPAITDLLGGQVQGLFADAPVLLPQISGGTLKPLGVASAKHNPKLPNVATLEELGFHDTEADNWYGLLAPARTPPAVVAKLNRTVVAAINDPVVNGKLVESGAVPAPTSPEDFGKLLKNELERWTRIVRERGIKE